MIIKSESCQVLHRMAKYDFANRIGSQSRSEDDDDVNLDMKFFEHYRGKIQMCLPIDPNVCGNLERRGNLKTILPEIKHSQERVAQCQDNFDNFCVKLFGGDYTWIHSVTSDICGQASFSRAKGINTVQYAAVATYKGQADSVIGTTFVSFLVLLLFIWGMLLIAEIRATYNFLYVVWYTASTENTDPNFACFKDKLVVKQLPRSHKIFAVLCIGLPRLLIAIVLLIVGAKFLSATDNLQDLVLNATDSQRKVQVQVFYFHCLSLNCSQSDIAVSPKVGLLCTMCNGPVWDESKDSVIFHSAMLKGSFSLSCDPKLQGFVLLDWSGQYDSCCILGRKLWKASNASVRCLASSSFSTGDFAILYHICICSVPWQEWEPGGQGFFNGSISLTVPRSLSLCFGKRCNTHSSAWLAQIHALGGPWGEVKTSPDENQDTRNRIDLPQGRHQIAFQLKFIEMPTSKLICCIVNAMLKMHGGNKWSCG